MKVATLVASALVLVGACKKDEAKKQEAPAPRVEPEAAPRVEPTAPAVPSRGSGLIAGLGGRFGDLLGDVPAEMAFPPAAAKGGDCVAVGDRLLLVIESYLEAELSGVPEEDREATRAMIGGSLADMRGQLVAMCADEAWSPELRDCALTATTVAAFEACDRFAPT